jgi:hypothetical protein
MLNRLNELNGESFNGLDEEEQGKKFVCEIWLGHYGVAASETASRTTMRNFLDLAVYDEETVEQRRINTVNDRFKQVGPESMVDLGPGGAGSIFRAFTARLAESLS